MRCFLISLAKYLELDKVTLIKCGGKDRIASEREQWNDGSNTLCIEPGKVVVYDRNYVTNDICVSMVSRYWKWQVRSCPEVVVAHAV